MAHAWVKRGTVADRQGRVFPSNLTREGRAALALSAVAVVVAMGVAVAMAWTCDDAYISFRYARNLVAGHGLVFNIGEYVEGYTNFSWTLLAALGLRLGCDVELWTNGLSLGCHALLLILLGRHTWCTRRSYAATGMVVPVALIAAAAHRDLAVFATGGLETALFTLLVFGAYCGISPMASVRPWRAGLLLGIAMLTRPDAAIFVAAAATWLWAVHGWRAALHLAVTTAVVVVPFLVWRHAYYGDWLPNTYYAKSAQLAWWDQGLFYVGIYFAKYRALALVPLFAYPAVRFLRRSGASAVLREVALATLFAVAYSAAVARVGGDFMFARFLIPATPFYLILLEIVVLGLAGAAAQSGVPRVAVASALAAAVVAVFVLTPAPVDKWNVVRGVTDEWACYQPSQQWTETARSCGQALAKITAGLPVQLAFDGACARTVYFAGDTPAIEASTGLTDHQIAHQPLAARGRPGHEKPASARVLLDRGVHLLLSPSSMRKSELAALGPLRRMLFDGYKVWVLRWDEALMQQMRERGAQFEARGSAGSAPAGKPAVAPAPPQGR